jgi:hypothetical protein
MSKWRGGVLLGGGLVMALVGAASWLAPAALVSGAGKTEVGVAPASKNVKNDGNTFTVDINVSDVNNLGAFDFTITFDNGVLEYVGLADGGFLTTTGRSATCIRPAAGPNGESREAIANQYGALHYGCTTFGLISGNSGKPGPDGSGTLATLTFKPKNVGEADLKFEGLEGEGVFKIGPSGEPIDAGFTGLGGVEVCPDNDDCDPISIEMDVQNGIIEVYDSSQAEPTAPPATPTRVPRNNPPLTQATVDAALASTPGTGAPGSTPGTRGNGPTGTIAGTTGGGRTGVQSGSNAAARGPNGAPLAGYGPQESAGPSWPGRTSVVLMVAGVAAMAAGVGLRRRIS